MDEDLENQYRMPEAEVSLRLALYLLKNKVVSTDVSIALDGAQIKTGKNIHFPINEFLLSNNCEKITGQGRQGVYKVPDSDHAIIIHSIPGKGDVVTKLVSGNGLRVECKKGPLIKSKSSQEYPLLREAIGQLMTINEINETDRFAVAVPYSPKFKELTSIWKSTPLIQKIQLKFLLVGRNGDVDGMDD